MGMKLESLSESARTTILAHLEGASEIEFDIDGPIPSKKNSRITNRKTGMSFPSAAYKKWHKENLNKCPQIDWNGSLLKITIHIRFKDLRKADITNKVESVMDMMVDAGTIEDDSWKICPFLVLTGSLDRENPGASICIEKLPLKAAPTKLSGVL